MMANLEALASRRRFHSAFIATGNQEARLCTLFLEPLKTMVGWCRRNLEVSISHSQQNLETVSYAIVVYKFRRMTLAVSCEHLLHARANVGITLSIDRLGTRLRESRMFCICLRSRSFPVSYSIHYQPRITLKKQETCHHRALYTI